jgi:hypothetical protein
MPPAAAGGRSGAPVDLAALAARVDKPDPDVAARTRAALTERDPDGDFGRLADAAVWWASVAPGTDAGRPRAPQEWRTWHLWAPLDPPDDVDAAMAWGIAAADEAADAGTDLLVVSVPDPAATLLLAAAVMDVDPMEAFGWSRDRPGRGSQGGPGLDDAAWLAEIVRLRDGLYRMRGLRDRPADLLRAHGSGSVAAGTALLIQSAARRTPALLDGFGATMCGLMARRVARRARSWWQAAGGTTAPLHARALSTMGLTPLTDLGIGSEDGAAGRLAVHVLRAAAELLRERPPADVPEG